MEKASQHHWTLGFGLALLVALLWGVLPIALKVMLVSLDAWTITWTRFAGAMIFLGLWLARRRQLPLRELYSLEIWKWLIPGMLGLTGNYILYLLGLHYTSPIVAQTVIQLSPLLLLLLGVSFFHERFSTLQWLGFGTLVGGLLIFFNRRLPELLAPTQGWALGIVVLVISAASWAIYGVSQKKLSRHLTSAQILFVIYVGATVLLSPKAAPSSLSRLTFTGWMTMGFCILNTIVAYGAFAVALNVWEVSRVSSVLATAPLFTLIASAVASNAAVGWIQPESVTALSVIGALSVVAGSAISALGNRPIRRIDGARAMTTPSLVKSGGK